MRITIKQLLLNIKQGDYPNSPISSIVAGKIAEDLSLDDYDGVDTHFSHNLSGYIVEGDLVILTPDDKYLLTWHSYCHEVSCKNTCSSGYVRNRLSSTVQVLQQQMEALFIDLSYQTPKYNTWDEDSEIEFYEQTPA